MEATVFSCGARLRRYSCACGAKVKVEGGDARKKVAFFNSHLSFVQKVDGVFQRRQGPRGCELQRGNRRQRALFSAELASGAGTVPAAQSSIFKGGDGAKKRCT